MNTVAFEKICSKFSKRLSYGTSVKFKVLRFALQFCLLIFKF